MRSIGWPELIIILLVILLLFGARRLPDLARSLGRSLSEFKKGRTDGMKDVPNDKPDQEEEKK